MSIEARKGPARNEIDKSKGQGGMSDLARFYLSLTAEANVVGAIDPVRGAGKAAIKGSRPNGQDIIWLKRQLEEGEHDPIGVSSGPV